ncbi:MAG: TonB-dependent receptor [Halieaceae bacterium]|nr:TonB-dependent receptor [Halieaceae bacterium]
MQRGILAVVAVGLLGNTAALAENHRIEEVTIVGSREDARALAGSGSVIDNEQILIEATGDIHQLLQSVPGVYIMEEDGYGLRPNIGIRGATSERSSRITLMEDGVLIAPAPYSNPAAYYFPTVLRMSSIEVLKGAPLLRHGPQTTGGVVNMVSTPIPEQRLGNLDLSYGQNNEVNMLGNYGVRSGDFGALVETVQRSSDGFKDIDRSSADTGFDIQDYLVKLLWEGERQSVLLKAQYSEENSDETYLGLTDRDFDRDANRRYGLSRIDKMENDHEGYNLTYRLAVTDRVTMTATGYYNRFARDWFKLNGGSAFIDAANQGDAIAEGVLDGSLDATGLKYKHNNRKYESYGLELNFDVDLGAHQLALGARPHEDEADYFQPIEIYDQINGQLVYVSTTQPVGGDNREESADAWSFWAVDSWQVTDALSVNLALRYEDVQSQRKDYADPGRSAVSGERKNDTDEWLPGASFTYDLTDSWQLLAGVHKGFSPLGGSARENEDPETSTNWEAGIRYHADWFVEAIGFYSDFENKTEFCSNASPCSNGEVSGSFNTGKAEIAGLELQVGTTLTAGSLSIPMDLTYTYTDATISEDNAFNGFEEGDELAAIPKNTFGMKVGLEANNGWNNYLIARYTDSMCIRVGCNNDDDAFDSTEDFFTLEYISRYPVTDTAVAYLKVENVLDEQRIVARQPEGARPNKPFTASVGVQWQF